MMIDNKLLLGIIIFIIIVLAMEVYLAVREYQEYKKVNHKANDKFIW